MEYTKKTITTSATIAALHTAADDADALKSAREYVASWRGVAPVPAEDLPIAQVSVAMIRGVPAVSDRPRIRLAESLAKAIALTTLCGRRYPELDFGMWRAALLESLPHVLLDDEDLMRAFASMGDTLRAMADHITESRRVNPKPLDIAGAIAAKDGGEDPPHAGSVITRTCSCPTKYSAQFGYVGIDVSPFCEIHGNRKPLGGTTPDPGEPPC